MGSLFSLYYFHHEKDGDQRRLHNQAHTLDGIIIGCSSTLNALLVYNPRNKQYYKPDSYRINSSIGSRVLSTTTSSMTAVCCFRNLSN
jgi:hypothetical protein